MTQPTDADSAPVHRMRPATPDPELMALLERAYRCFCTAERRPQRISWVIGNLPTNTTLTRADVERAYDEMYGGPTVAKSATVAQSTDTEILDWLDSNPPELGDIQPPRKLFHDPRWRFCRNGSDNALSSATTFRKAAKGAMTR